MNRSDDPSNAGPSGDAGSAEPAPSAPAEMERVSYGGWPNCIRLYNDQIELIATTDVGPRIIRVGFNGGENLFKEYPDQMGTTGGDEWRIYGGHRLWHAPEREGRTYVPDNGSIESRWDGSQLVLRPPTETPTGISKEMAVSVGPRANQVVVRHRLTNANPWTIEAAGWALSVMRTGGRAIVPQEEHVPHGEALGPARPLVLWTYTDMSDPRWTWGDRYVRLRQDPEASSPQKAGMTNSLGWAVYAHDERVFLKRYPAFESSRYPDYGCNTEIFTNPSMLELETLGPLRKLAPMEQLEHVEHWYLFRRELGSDEESITSAVEPLLAQTAQPSPTSD